LEAAVFVAEGIDGRALVAVGMGVVGASADHADSGNDAGCDKDVEFEGHMISPD
jgi:hypothetical protein